MLSELVAIVEKQIADLESEIAEVAADRRAATVLHRCPWMVWTASFGCVVAQDGDHYRLASPSSVTRATATATLRRVSFTRERAVEVVAAFGAQSPQLADLVIETWETGLPRALASARDALTQLRAVDAA